MVPPDLTSPMPAGWRPEATVIGASAGAIDALSQILPALPENAETPFIVVVHLPSGKPSLLVDILAPKCRLPVATPLDKQIVGRGIWIAAPDYHLLIEGDRSFGVSVDDPVNYSRPSVDVLFESAADVYGDKLAAVVLTGGNDDGARGARKVRDLGGLVIVQDPAEAVASFMPSSAIEAAAPQLVLPLAEVARRLAAISWGP